MRKQVEESTAAESARSYASSDSSFSWLDSLRQVE